MKGVLGNKFILLGLLPLIMTSCSVLGNCPSVPDPVASPLSAPVAIDTDTYHVSWDAPANNGNPITNYVVYAFTCDGDYTGQHVYTGSDQTVSDFGPATEARGRTLNPGVSYKFTVRSQNRLGWDATTFDTAAATSYTESVGP